MPKYHRKPTEQEREIARKAIAKVIGIHSGQAATARQITFEQPTVFRWLNEGEIDPTSAVELADSTKNQVKCYELCPHFPWDRARRPRKSG